MIANVLADRIASTTWYSRDELVGDIHEQRASDRFPPAYQAQVIEEMSGERYFRALQSLDIDTSNSSHNAIAALAAAHCLNGIVTTNFDRLIEQALKRHRVPYEVAYDPSGYKRLVTRRTSSARSKIPVIKVHGCVSDHRSMIDTLKQRKLGRSRHLQECLEAFGSSFWLYLGFSAADLDIEPGYLGLTSSARGSLGAMYVKFPGSPRLGVGAKRLLAAYGRRGTRVDAEIPAVVNALLDHLGASRPVTIAESTCSGVAEVENRLEAWAKSLPPATAGLCLAAMLEAVGESEKAVRLLDRLVRKTKLERNNAEFRLLQLHLGRLGAAWGRFIDVRDMAGAESNIFIESVQSVARIQDTELKFSSFVCQSTLNLWLDGDGEAATTIANYMSSCVATGRWLDVEPRSPEEALDGWLAAAQVHILNTSPASLGRILDSSRAALTLAENAGDVVRAARVASLTLLAAAHGGVDLRPEEQRLQRFMDEAALVHDGFALAFWSLALGRWKLSNAGRRLLGGELDKRAVASAALANIQEATRHFESKIMLPWIVYARLQSAKAYADRDDLEDAARSLESAWLAMEQFPIFASHYYETLSQIGTIVDDTNAAKFFRVAVTEAQRFGLTDRAESLRRHVPPTKPSRLQGLVSYLRR